MKSVATKCLLLLILILGLGLRLHRFDAIAPSNSDEASYLRHARFMVTLGRYACGVPVPVIDASKTGIWRGVRKEDWSAKPCWLHSGFLAGSMALFGVNDAAGAAVSVVFSMVAVWLCFAIGREIADSIAGLSAALCLAVSFYWMLYSRGMWAEVDSVCFALLGFYLVLVAIRYESANPKLDRLTARFGFARTPLVRDAAYARVQSADALAPLYRKALHRSSGILLLAGASAGLGVLCHYRLLYVIAPLGLSLALLTPPRRWVPAGMALGIGFVGTILAAAAVLRLAASAAGPEAPFTGLIGALLERYLPGETGVEQKGVQVGNILAVAYYFLRNHGWVMTAATALGGGVALLNVRYDRRYAALLVMTLFPLGVLCFQVWVVARAASMMIPLVCVLAGIGLATVWRLGDALVARWRRIPRTMGLLLVSGVLVENAIDDLRLARNRMGYQEAATVLAEEAYDVVFVDPEAEILYGWYKPAVPYRSIRELYGAASFAGITNGAVVFDAQRHHMYPASSRLVAGLEQRIASEHTLATRLPNMVTTWREFLLDGTQAHSLEGMKRSLREAVPEEICTIRIYGL